MTQSKPFSFIVLMSAVLMLALSAAAPAAAQADPAAAARRRQAREAREALLEKQAKARAATPYKAAAIMTLPAAKLAAMLEDPRASDFAKAKACQRLALVGDKSSAPPLAALLGDEKLGHYARFGLEAIPGPAVDALLREALAKLEGDLLIGVINSIGRRKDPQALAPLAKIIHGDDQKAAEAARAALGRIRSP